MLALAPAAWTGVQLVIFGASAMENLGEHLRAVPRLWMLPVCLLLGFSPGCMAASRRAAWAAGSSLLVKVRGSARVMVILLKGFGIWKRSQVSRVQALWARRRRGTTGGLAEGGEFEDAGLGLVAGAAGGRRG